MSARSMLVIFAVLVAACGAGDFTPASELLGVRILSARVEPPYAAPGEKVKFELLAFDGRKDKTRPMKISWIPLPCINPRQDLYYACFAQLAAGGGNGGGGGGAGAEILRPGVDLSPFLPSGPTFEITLPQNIVAAHPPVAGADAPYGLAIVFMMACAGHVELVPIESDNPQAIPIACFDEDHKRLGADDFVVGFARAYAYDQRRNQNPEIDGVTVNGQPVDLAKGIDFDHCTTPLRRDCPKHKIDVVVPASSQEIHEGNTTPDGRVRREQIWAAYFADIGQINSEARLIYEPLAGRVTGSENDYQPPNDPGDGTMFIVVHDNRNGAKWVQVPLHVH